MKNCGVILLTAGICLALTLAGSSLFTTVPYRDVALVAAALVSLAGLGLWLLTLPPNHPRRGATLRTLPLVAVLLVLLLVFGSWFPGFLRPANLVDLAQQISVNAILAFGMTLVILIGGIDLSVGALLALVGTTTVYLLTARQADTQDLLWTCSAMFAGLGVAAALGAFNGVLAATSRMPAFIITLATMLIARGAARRFNQGQPLRIPDHETFFQALGFPLFLQRDLPAILKVPVPALVMLVVFVLTAVLLHRTRFGQHIYAIGGSRQAARFTGIPVVRTEILVYVLCSVLTGIAGMIHTSQLVSAQASSGEGFELNAIAAAVVGGTSFTGGQGTMFGTLLGAIIIGILNKGLNQAGVHYSWQLVVKGVVILGAVYLDVRRRNR
jgi:ribose transport system permease protein